MAKAAGEVYTAATVSSECEGQRQLLYLYLCRWGFAYSLHVHNTLQGITFKLSKPKILQM